MLVHCPAMGLRAHTIRDAANHVPWLTVRTASSRREAVAVRSTPLPMSAPTRTGPSASPQECLGIILGAPGSSPAPEATLERGAPSKGSYTTGLEEVH